MLADAESGKFDLLVVKTASQLSSDEADAMRVVSTLRGLPDPIGVHFLDINANSLDPQFDITIAEQEESRLDGEDIDELWTEVCSNDQEAVRSYYESGGKRNLRYSAFGQEHSLIMDAPLTEY